MDELLKRLVKPVYCCRCRELMVSHVSRSIYGCPKCEWHIRAIDVRRGDIQYYGDAVREASDDTD